MSSYNSSLPSSDHWSGYVAQAQFPLTPRLALFALFNIPILAIFLNVIWQLVRDSVVFGTTTEQFPQLPSRDRSAPPVVFHWLPFIGSAIHYGNDPLNFYFQCREKVNNHCIPQVGG